MVSIHSRAPQWASQGFGRPAPQFNFSLCPALLLPSSFLKSYSPMHILHHKLHLGLASKEPNLQLVCACVCVCVCVCGSPGQWSHPAECNNVGKIPPPFPSKIFLRNYSWANMCIIPKITFFSSRWPSQTVGPSVSMASVPMSPQISWVVVRNDTGARWCGSKSNRQENGTVRLTIQDSARLSPRIK